MMSFLRRTAALFRMPKGQTMAEYALLLASVAVIVYAAYQKMGTTITTLLTTVDGKI